MAKDYREATPSNAQYIKDYDYSVQVNRWFLKPIGIWPSGPDASRSNRIFSRLLNVACHSLVVFTFAPCVMFILFEETSLDARIQAIGPMSHWLMGELNYCCLSFRTNDIFRCIEHMKTDWKTIERPSDRQLMLKNAKVGRSIATVAAICMNLGVISYNLVTGFQKLEFRVGNDSYSMLRLPCPFYSNLMDVRHSPANEIVYFLQLVSGLIVNSVTVGACGMAGVFAMHACGQLNVVTSQLKHLVEPNEEQTFAKKKLTSVVERHSRTLNFVWYIEKIMHLICLVELMGCTLNICMLEYYMLTEDTTERMATYAIVYVSMIFNTFIFCYIGEKLTVQCLQVGEKAYMTQWYRLPHKTAAGLTLMISRSRMVTRITAGKLLPISISTFGDVFKTSFLYFDMLRRLTM
ncbi:odorant receptor 26 [Halictus rubicundus]|uniref:odorant receptor 26 n=1 Tax=Halictus rubicundus TaxID=77578 RepID=UPI0040351A45